MSSRAPVQLDGASCLVCGVGGIGAAVANELERRAARLTLANRTVAGLAERHPAAVVVEADLCSPGGRERALSAAVEHGGGLDVLVCAVGVVAFGPVVELEESVARTLLDVNVLAPVMLAAAVAFAFILDFAKVTVFRRLRSHLRGCRCPPIRTPSSWAACFSSR